MTAKTCIIDHYKPEYACITIDELRTLLRMCKRHSEYYTYFLLRATTGIRNAELLYLSLTNLYRNGKVIRYQIVKPKVSENMRGEIQIDRKHREVVLDEWVAKELRTYLELNFASSIDGKKQYSSPYHSFDPNTGVHKKQLLFRWANSQVIACYWSRLKKRMGKINGIINRLERSSFRPYNDHTELTYVFRTHMLRHLYCSVMYIKNHHDIKKVQEIIGHSKTDTTQKYIHSPEHLGSTEEYLLFATWAEICGYEDNQETLCTHTVTEQTSLDMF